MTSTTTERLREAAFELFVEQGFDATSIDAIAERAGVGRSTYFRTFPTKEAVIFPDHDEVIARIEARLSAAASGHHFLAVREAAQLVLRHYLDEGERARVRYRLTRSVPALREREIASMQRYLQTFRSFISEWDGDSLHAELLASAVVTAHNHVLRRWLRATTTGPTATYLDEFDVAMAEVERLFTSPSAPVGQGGHVVVLGPGADLDEALDAVRRVLS